MMQMVEMDVLEREEERMGNMRLNQEASEIFMSAIRYNEVAGSTQFVGSVDYDKSGAKEVSQVGTRKQKRKEWQRQNRKLKFSRYIRTDA